MSIITTVINQLASERFAATNEFIRCINKDLQAALAYIENNLPISDPGQLPGTKTNDDADAGNVGEYLSAYVNYNPGVMVPNGGYISMCSISLTPGDWDLAGVVSFRAIDGIELAGNFIGGFSDTPDSSISYANYQQFFFTNPTIPFSFSCSCIPVRVSLAAPKTLYANAGSTWTGGTGFTVNGKVRARRVR